jgi:GNAT superfamily N-acetyltransferase
VDAKSANASSFKVRPARRGDAGPIVALLAEAGATASNDTVTWIISHPEMEILVAADSWDKCIGVATLSHRPVLKLGGRAATLDELAVLKAWRRKGVGRLLAQKAIERAKVLGVKRLEVQTFGAPDEGTTAFFLAIGFHQALVGVFRLG